MQLIWCTMHLMKAMKRVCPEYVTLCGIAQEAQQEAATSSSAHPPLAATSAHDVIVGTPSTSTS